MPSRRLFREAAFQFLYGVFSKPQQTEPKTGGFVVQRITPKASMSDAEASSPAISDLKEEIAEFCSNFRHTPDPFLVDLVEGTVKNLKTIDQHISELSSHWKIERMPKVDLTVLRLACFEILYCSDIPKNVSINEAIELGKKFGAEDSSSFINGILDKVSKPNVN